jgi:hypothetical protein
MKSGTFYNLLSKLKIRCSQIWDYFGTAADFFACQGRRFVPYCSRQKAGKLSLNRVIWYKFGTEHCNNIQQQKMQNAVPG